uniref:Uncharacterized protein n=1 Tax=Romanomermis culicivorax TaxID=13658 RepID=A0A915KPJ5_ROMCU
MLFFKIRLLDVYIRRNSAEECRESEIMLIHYLLLIIVSQMLINFGDAKDSAICRSRTYTCFACMEKPGGMSMTVASRRCSNEFNNSMLAFDDEILDSKALYGASGFDDGNSNEPKFCHSKDLLWTGFLYVNNTWWFRDHWNQRMIESFSFYNAKYALRKYLWNSTTNENEFIKIDKMSAEMYEKEYAENNVHIPSEQEILCGAISLTKKLLLPMRCDESTKVTGAICSSDISRCVRGYGENYGQNCTVRQRGRKSKPLRVYCKRRADVDETGVATAGVHISHDRPCNYSKNALRL